MELAQMNYCCGIIMMEGLDYSFNDRDLIENDDDDDVWEDDDDYYDGDGSNISQFQADWDSQLANVWYHAGFVSTVLCAVPDHDEYWKKMLKFLKDFGFKELGKPRPRSEGHGPGKIHLLQFDLEPYKEDGKWKKMVKKHITNIPKYDSRW